MEKFLKVNREFESRPDLGFMVARDRFELSPDILIMLFTDKLG